MAIDTAGLENEINENSLQQKMFEQAQLAVIDADLCLFVVDGKEGVTNDS
jgi:predicted GTPase